MARTYLVLRLQTTEPPRNERPESFMSEIHEGRSINIGTMKIIHAMSITLKKIMILVLI